MATAATSLLDSETFSASSERDAVNRVLTAISPDDSEVIYTYDEGGALQAVEVKHRGSSTAETVVGDITYNARGQRESVVYGSTSSPTTTTSYTYDPQTYRLASLSTVRGSDDANLQGLHYHYDPVGNITDIRDTAQQTVYFNNSVVEAANSYTYDATYRLIEATGREHSTQGTTQRTDVQITPGPQPMTSDPSAMRRYTQKFTYDEVGNILKMQHIPASGSGWTRYYEYDADGNRLEKTSAPGDPANGPYTHAYTYDAHGNMTAMPHLSSMVWNHDDELCEVTVGTETVYFQYAGGMRSRKYVEQSGATTEERIYLGPFELYRKRISGTLDLERESLHISDDTGRICIIETKTVDGGSAVGSPTGIWRYQLSNHLGSAATEVDESGAVISYEEYHPYGTSAYRAVDASIDVSAKRYRYTGMERDEETGLAYHSARYYAPWLARWTAADPIGLSGGMNVFRYSSPTILIDLTGTNGTKNNEDPPTESTDERQAAPAPSNDWTAMVETEILGRTLTTSTRLQTDIIERELRNLSNNDALQALLSQETAAVGASSFDQGDARIDDAAATIVKLLEYQFIHDESRSGLELLAPGDRARYSNIAWVDSDFPGDGGPHQSDAKELQRKLVARAGGERRPNQGPHAVMTVSEFQTQEWQNHIVDQLVSVDGSNHRLNAITYGKLLEMQEAAEADGVSLEINIGSKNAYRTPAAAATAGAARNNAQAVAASISAHSLGNTADFRLSHGSLSFIETTTAFTNLINGYRSPVYKWLALYGDQYGFYNYRAEPWHWEHNPEGFKGQFREGGP